VSLLYFYNYLEKNFIQAACPDHGNQLVFCCTVQYLYLWPHKTATVNQKQSKILCYHRYSSYMENSALFTIEKSAAKHS